MTVKSFVLHFFSGPPNRKQYNKHLIYIASCFLVRIVHYESSFFFNRFMAHARKSSVGNVLYGPKTRLIRGIYVERPCDSLLQCSIHYNVPKLRIVFKKVQLTHYRSYHDAKPPIFIVIRVPSSSVNHVCLSHNGWCKCGLTWERLGQCPSSYMGVFLLILIRMPCPPLVSYFSSKLRHMALCPCLQAHLSPFFLSEGGSI